MLELELLFVGIAEARLASPLLQGLERLWNQGSDERKQHKNTRHRFETGLYRKSI
jgi:hypothetical protein